MFQPHPSFLRNSHLLHFTQSPSSTSQLPSHPPPSSQTLSIGSSLPQLRSQAQAMATWEPQEAICEAEEARPVTLLPHKVGNSKMSGQWPPTLASDAAPTLSVWWESRHLLSPVFRTTARRAGGGRKKGPWGGLPGARRFRPSWFFLRTL